MGYQRDNGYHIENLRDTYSKILQMDNGYRLFLVSSILLLLPPDFLNSRSGNQPQGRPQEAGFPIESCENQVSKTEKTAGINGFPHFLKKAPRLECPGIDREGGIASLRNHGFCL